MAFVAFCVGIVGTPLRRRAEDVAAPRIRRKRLAVPLLDGVRGIGDTTSKRMSRSPSHR